MTALPKLYTELADWWSVLSAPGEYAEEATFFGRLIVESAAVPPLTLLELGCGGGNNASFLKQHFQMTLTEVSPRMLDQSRHLNQECEHVTGDMRPFSERVWLRCLVGPGFEARKLPIVHSEVEPGSCDIFVGLKPACRG